MNNLKRIATPLIAVAMMTIPMMALAQSSQQGNATQNSTTKQWATPPADAAQAQAYNDGIEAAKLDAAAKRPVDATKSHLYVNPPVKKDARDGYRTSFTAGYTAAVTHGSNNAGGGQ
jgi:hypothetical protein